MSSIWQEGQELLKETADLITRRTRVSVRLKEILLESIPDITLETRSHFQVDELMQIEAKISLPSIEKFNLVGVTELAVRFNINGKTYWVDVFVRNFLRVREKLGDGEMIQFQFATSRLNSDHIEGIRDEKRITDFEESLKRMKDMQRLHDILNGRAESIFTFIQGRFMVYVNTDFYQRKQNSRMIIWSHATEDGYFAMLPKEIIHKICKEILK